MISSGRNKPMKNGIIYYTDNRMDGHPIGKASRETILAAGLPISSCSLKPIDFGDNVVLEGEVRSYPTMAKQIYMALQNSKADNVFFCEHDVLYHPSHFEFTPPGNTLYYYNVNNWRWLYGSKNAINYDDLTSLSGLSVSRQLALEHYELRLKRIEEMGLDAKRGAEPRWARLFGYEPGTKRVRRGGFSDEQHKKRWSDYPNVDVRHPKAFSRPKITLAEFKHKPFNWREKPIEDIPGWDLKTLLNL